MHLNDVANYYLFIMLSVYDLKSIFCDRLEHRSHISWYVMLSNKCRILVYVLTYNINTSLCEDILYMCRHPIRMLNAQCSMYLQTVIYDQKMPKWNTTNSFNFNQRMINSMTEKDRRRENGEKGPLSTEHWTHHYAMSIIRRYNIKSHTFTHINKNNNSTTARAVFTLQYTRRFYRLF